MPAPMVLEIPFTDKASFSGLGFRGSGFRVRDIEFRV